MISNFLRSTFGGLAIALLGLAAQPAKAATIEFVIDRDASSVILSDTGGFCVLSRCGVSAALAAGLQSGDAYTIGTGDVAAFDFLTFTGRGTGTDTFSIAAQLAFSAPSVVVQGTGTGGAILAFGQIAGGVLTWDALTVTGGWTPAASEIGFLFQGGAGLFMGSTVTTQAAIIGTSVVPIPAAGLLLVTALGGLAALRRRRAFA